MRLGGQAGAVSRISILNSGVLLEPSLRTLGFEPLSSAADFESPSCAADSETSPAAADICPRICVHSPLASAIASGSKSPSNEIFYMLFGLWCGAVGGEAMGDYYLCFVGHHIAGYASCC